MFDRKKDTNEGTKNRAWEYRESYEGPRLNWQEQIYPVERYMKILKGYVKNQCRPEASIIERYILEESIEFCSEYLSKAKCIGVPKKCWYSCRLISKSSKGLHVISKSREEVLQAHLYILNNTDGVLPYLLSNASG